MRKYKIIFQALQDGKIVQYKYFNQSLSDLMRTLQLQDKEGFEIVSIVITYEKPIEEINIPSDEQLKFN